MATLALGAVGAAVGSACCRRHHRCSGRPDRCSHRLAGRRPAGGLIDQSAVWRTGQARQVAARASPTCASPSRAKAAHPAALRPRPARRPDDLGDQLRGRGRRRRAGGRQGPRSRGRRRRQRRSTATTPTSPSACARARSRASAACGPTARNWTSPTSPGASTPAARTRLPTASSSPRRAPTAPGLSRPRLRRLRAAGAGPLRQPHPAAVV